MMDNLAVHKTETVRNIFRPYEDRVHIHWLPKHASWLSQVEIFFSILTRRLLKRGDFKNRQDLVNRVIRFIEWYCEHEAQPFRWTYTGQPLLQ